MTFKNKKKQLCLPIASYMRTRIIGQSGQIVYQS